MTIIHCGNGPLKFWLLNREIEISDEIATTLDMSHAFTGIEIKGDSSTLFLNRHLPIDLSKNFPDLSSASTAIHHVSIKLFKISLNNYVYTYQEVLHCQFRRSFLKLQISLDEVLDR